MKKYNRFLNLCQKHKINSFLEEMNSVIWISFYSNFVSSLISLHKEGYMPKKIGFNNIWLNSIATQDFKITLTITFKKYK